MQHNVNPNVLTGESALCGALYTVNCISVYVLGRQTKLGHWGVASMVTASKEADAPV